MSVRRYGECKRTGYRAQSDQLSGRNLGVIPKNAFVPSYVCQIISIEEYKCLSSDWPSTYPNKFCPQMLTFILFVYILPAYVYIYHEDIYQGIIQY